ncbi:MAG: aspartyl protease family protein [Dehalococcoidia bacterium]
MGIFSVEIQIGDPQGKRFEPAKALVDTGSSYSAFPVEQLRRLGVEPSDRQQFLLADGRIVESAIGETRIKIDGRMRTTVVVFSDEGTQPLIGAVTLEEFGLAVDPIGQKLMPVPGYRLGRKPL